MSIHSYAVDTGVFDPPDAVLRKVFHQVRIMLVQVGHRLHKPSHIHNIFIVSRNVRIEMRRQPIRSLYISVRKVEPIFRRTVEKPYMFTPAVVEDHVHYHFHISFVTFFNQPFVIFIRSEARIYFVVIRRSVSVIRSSRHVVLQYRIQPDSCHSQILYIIQMLLYTLQVASMTGIGIIAIYRSRKPHGRYYICFRVFIGKSVGHDQIQHVRSVKSRIVPVGSVPL